MKLFLLSFSLLLSLFSVAQTALKGVVTDAEKGQPVPGASVFLSNTSVGTITNAQGAFTINIPAGRYDLIVSSIGFETYNQTINSTALPANITIKLTPKAKELETVVVQAFEKDGWKKWGTFFTEHFIGKSSFAKGCVLKNSAVLKFRHSKKEGELTAIALEPLVIENKALGYNIRYQMEAFSFNFKTGYLYFGGYPLFENMAGNAAKQRRWMAARKEVYYGSMMHFMRSLFRNTLQQENFEVYALKKVLNEEKKRVKEANSKRMRKAPDNTITVQNIGRDSSEYYDRILAQSDYFDVVGRSKLTGDSIAYAVNATTAGLDFRDYLLIIYAKGTAMSEYRQQNPKSSATPMSQVTLINQKLIEIGANGSYYEPADFMSLGYWAWFEKMATMLPFDYELEK